MEEVRQISERNHSGKAEFAITCKEIMVSGGLKTYENERVYLCYKQLLTMFHLLRKYQHCL